MAHLAESEDLRCEDVHVDLFKIEWVIPRGGNTKGCDSNLATYLLEMV